MSLLAFSALMWVAQFSPGPDMMLLTQTAVVRGRKAAILTVLGIVLGLTVHCLLIFGGGALLLLNSPKVFSGLQLLGSLYLIWLGGTMLRLAFKIESKTPSMNEEKDRFSSPFLQGLMTNLLNVKAILFLSGSLTAAHSSSQGVAHAVALVAIVLGQALFGWLVYVLVLGGGRIQSWLQRFQRQWNSAFGLMLVILGFAGLCFMVFENQK